MIAVEDCSSYFYPTPTNGERMMEMSVTWYFIGLSGCLIGGLVIGYLVGHFDGRRT
jgi:hypothetical protein